MKNKNGRLLPTTTLNLIVSYKITAQQNNLISSIPTPARWTHYILVHETIRTCASLTLLQRDLQMKQDLSKPTSALITLPRDVLIAKTTHPTCDFRRSFTKCYKIVQSYMCGLFSMTLNLICFTWYNSLGSNSINISF